MNGRNPLRRLFRHLCTDRVSGAPRVPEGVAAANRGGDRRRREASTAASCGSPSRRRFRSTRVLQGVAPRARALEVFGSLRIWDTAENCGVLVYLLLADHDVEIVADRGIHAQVGTAAWEAICRQDGGGVSRRTLRRRRRSRDSPRSTRCSCRHYPREGQPAGNELSDRPVLL